MSEIKCNAICKAEKRNNDGADSITKRMDPAAPDAAKNICMKIIPIEDPVDRMLLKNLENNVALNTVTMEIIGRA